MDCISDKRGKTLSIGAVVAYVENGLLEYGRIIDACMSAPCIESETVRNAWLHIAQLHDGCTTGLLVTRPAKAVMKIVLPDA